jgi:endonuclease/exonuclease/phosphatase family metal-dependent hydrolase
MYFLNTHFDHQGEKARVESARMVVRNVQSLTPGVPVVLTGDLNGRSDFEGYRILSAQLQDAEAVSQSPPQGGSMTFNGFGLDLQPGNKIDYIFVTPGLPVFSHQVVPDLLQGQYPSDHYPVVVALRIR